MSLRGLWVWIHRWVGLLMVLALVIEGLTGSLIAFRDPMSRWLAPREYAQAPAPGAPPLPLGVLAQRAQAHLGPCARIAYFFDGADHGQTRIRVGPATDKTTGKACTLDYGWVGFDPWTGRELARYTNEGYSSGVWANLMPFIYRLHVTLALDGVGSWILGITALAWTLDCLYALYLTLPRGRRQFLRRWKEAWQLRFNASALRLNFDLHRAGGLWFWALLLMFAWSSVQFTLFQVYEPVMSHLSDYQTFDQVVAGLPQHAVNTPARLDWPAAQAAGDALIAKRARAEGFQVVKPTLMAYFAPNGIYSYSVATDRGFPHFAEYNVWFNGDTGQLFRVQRSEGEHGGNTVSNWLRALHFASDPVDWLWYRWLICITGLYLVVLCATGVYLWWKKRRSRIWSRARGARHRDTSPAVDAPA